MRLEFCSLASLTRLGLRLTRLKTIAVRQSAVRIITPSRLSGKRAMPPPYVWVRPAGCGPGQGSGAEPGLLEVDLEGRVHGDPVHLLGHVPVGLAPVGL